MTAIVLTALISLVLLIGSVVKGIFIGIPLTIFLLMLWALCYNNGKSISELKALSITGFGHGLPIFSVLLMVSALISLWMASGTVAALVYYSLFVINPSLVVVSGFLLSAATSMLLGTSNGTLGTIGVVLLVLAKAGGISEAVMAGALISGAFVGDKASPMASALNMYCVLIDEDIYKHSRAMVKSSLIPVGLTGVIYYFISLSHPMAHTTSQIGEQLLQTYHIGLPSVLPAVVVFLLCVVKVRVKRALAVGIVLSAAVAVMNEQQSVSAVITYACMGYRLDAAHPLAAIFSSGGMVSIIKTLYIVGVSCMAAAIIEHGGLLPKGVERFVHGATSRTSMYLRTFVVALFGGTWGCGQTVAVVMTTQLMQSAYKEKGYDLTELTRDLGSTAFLMFVLLPWATTFINPTSILNIKGVSHLPYLVFTLVSPVYNLIYCTIIDMIEKQKANNAHTGKDLSC